MTSDILQAIGGVGLFLVGMILLTDGLRNLTGAALRRVLARFTSTPFSGAVTGALTTAVVQSSSATTVTVVGFVGAGLMTFPQALGVIFGANIGTTMTGWLVAILGFKLHLGSVVLPLILLGAVLRLFGGQRLGQAGLALAGFSLIFVGIDAMQAGMAGFEGAVTPDDFPGDTLLGRLQMLLVGVAITLVTQSSSAGVATALAALGAGAVSFPQACAMVIGMDVGTTFTAVLATLGGSTASRRTGYAHMIYNVLTGIMAFMLLGLFTRLTADLVASGQGQVALVAFHSSFNILGVILVLPLTGAFARLVTTLIPQRGDRLTQMLDPHLIREPEVAASATAATAIAIADESFRLIALRLTPDLRPAQRRQLGERRRAVFEAVTSARDYVERIVAAPGAVPNGARIVTVLHLLDHLLRLHYRLRQDARIDAIADSHRLRRLSGILQTLVGDDAAAADPDRSERRLNRFRRLMRRQRRKFRERTLQKTSAGALPGDAAMAQLDAARWLHRVSYHAWRIRHHVNRLRPGDQAPPIRAEAATDVRGD